MTFRGTSARSVAALSTELTTLVAGKADAATTAADLVGVAGVLRGSGALRRIFTEASITSEGDSEIVRELFTGKVSATALDFVVSVVAKPWTSGRDLNRAIDLLAARATVLSAGDEGSLVVDELFALAQIVRATPELRDALSDPVRSAEDKGALLAGLLEGKALPATIALARLAVTGTYGSAVTALTELREITAETLGTVPALIHAAKPLTEAQIASISDSLASTYGSVHANTVVEPALLGGVRIEIGDDVIDGTTITRLNEAGRLLAG